MTRSHDSTTTAGIDVSKDKLDVALSAGEARLSVPNSPDGHAGVAAFLRRHAITRVGLEATGSYGLAIEATLREEGFDVVVLQPVQVKLFRTLHRRHAKTDAIDAVLIARFVRGEAARADFHDARLAPWRERLLYVEQLRSDAARNRTRRDRYGCPELCARIEAEIRRIEREADSLFAQLLADLGRQPDLAARLALLISIPGIGDYSAAVLVLRLPELGHLSREEIAALVGVAPFNADSGRQSAPRRIAGGRKDVRDALYTPTMAASTRWNADLIAFGNRLRSAGKPGKLVIIACMRKLLSLANAILARGTPWAPKQSA